MTARQPWEHQSVVQSPMDNLQEPLDVKVLDSICLQIWKTQPWPQDWKRSVFIPIPNKGNANECSTGSTARSGRLFLANWVGFDFGLNSRKGLLSCSYLPPEPGEPLRDAFEARAGHEQPPPVLGLGPAILDPLTGQRSLLLEFQCREGRPDMTRGNKERRALKPNEPGWVRDAGARTR